MKKHLKFLVLILFLATVCSSCKKENLDDYNYVEERQNEAVYNSGKRTTSTSSGATVLGVKLQNPYSVSNMQQAYSNLQSKDPDFPLMSISTNYRYIKFMPQNEYQLDLLKSDSTIILYDIPLDYEILENGTYYQDPSLPDTAVTYQYCSLSINKAIPSVPYTILENLYIPPIEYDFSRGNAMTQYYEALEEEALRITDNLEPDDNTRASYWTPAGRIQMRDDVLGVIPIAGVKVRARRWFTTYEGITNSQGYFECNGQFKKEANYSFNWERYHFSIRSGEYGQAKYDGPKQKGNWNLLISGGSHEFYAIIFRAAFHYYYGDIQGLRRPPLNEVLGSQMKIAAKYENNLYYMGFHNSHWYQTIGITPRIKIYNPQVQSDTIYATTIHELAHTSHWNIDRSLYNEVGSEAIESIVIESWATGVQWSLTKMAYSDYDINNDFYSRCCYTGIVRDMIDGTGLKKSYYYYNYDNGDYIDKELSYNDRVSGYTIKQIEDALVNVRTWNEWRDNIKNMHENSTESHLNSAFTYWNTKTDNLIVTPPIKHDDSFNDNY